MRSMLPNPRRPLRLVRNLVADPAGSTAVIIALALSAIVGFAGLGTETASWYLTKRSMQGAADTAAATAAAELAASSSATITQMRSAARSVASRYGFVNDTASTTVTVNHPPASGTYDACPSGFAGTDCYVEVIISQPQTALLSAVFMSSGPTITARAVALANKKAGDSGCVLALSGASVVDIQLSGGVNLAFSNCALYDNSPLQSGALTMSNNVSLTASAAYIVGTPNQTTGLTTTDGTFTGVNPAADPYASVNLPVPHGNCDGGNNKLTNPNMSLSVTGDGTYVFCNDVEMNTNGGNPVLTLGPGTYIFSKGANLKMTSGTLQATGGVTLVFERADVTGQHPATNPGTVSINGNASMNIVAPTSGSTAGLAFFQERYTCTGSVTNCTNTFGGGGTLNITGAAYFPNNPVDYSGGSGAGGASQCTQLIANTITFSGGATFNNNCEGTGVQTISYTNGTLVM
ncbi:MAG TPA: pilus assembly protein TadG-related protein [Stellaceae bacterium]|nr:pilus assembly protein TadG-related protein [Stellaceae bacterium]